MIRWFCLFIGLQALRLYAQPLQCGADRIDEWAGSLKGKRLALAVNQTAMSKGVHLLDALLERGIRPVMVFAPEHGFRGEQDAGEHVNDTTDAKTGIRLRSLYGAGKKPKAGELDSVDVIIYDIQDVGARFYTYLSTLYYLMDACYLAGKEIWVLDRPNPNGNRIDGPVLEPAFKSFVGVVPIPVLHGLSAGEFAQMVNGEGWLESRGRCRLRIINCTGWKHADPWTLKVNPSPNLPNAQAICLYPSLCFFEGTRISVGRGTAMPFQTYGHPDFPAAEAAFTFKPMRTAGNKAPLLEGAVCHGFDLRKKACSANLDLQFLLTAWKLTPDKENFFLPNGFFDKLAGTDALRLQITEEASSAFIRESWKEGLETYQKIRNKYLLYP
jgi:uncharacterized protein YbbC (DUF1343 family)